MSEPPAEDRYTPCWAIVPISGADVKKKAGGQDEPEPDRPVEHVLFWLAVAWSAVGMYVIVKEML